MVSFASFYYKNWRKMKFLKSDFIRIFLSILFLSSINLYAKDINKFSIQGMLDTYVKNNHQTDKFSANIFTVQCAAYNKGQPITFNSGLQSEHGIPVNDNSLFQVGSITKSFISVIILQLESEGKLSIEDKVVNFFPKEYPNWKNITIKQLLNMTSGIQNYFAPEVPIWHEIREKPYHTFTTDELLNSVKNLDLIFIPGTKYNYSNTNYVLAGKIIEKVTAQSLAEEIENRIAKPLHLEHIFYINSFPKKDVPPSELTHLMSGYYTFADYILKPYYTYGQDIINYSVSMTNAAGAITANASDLNTYVRALFSTDPKKRLLPKKQFNELISLIDMTNGTPLPNGVNVEHQNGFGLGIIGTYDKTLNTMIYEYVGGSYGFLSIWRYIPGKNASYIYAINNSMPSSTFNTDLLEPLIKLFYQTCLL